MNHRPMSLLMHAARLVRGTQRLAVPAIVAGLAGSLCVTTAQAQDRAEVAPSQIIGNRELPKVLYIVPWKKPAPDPLAGKPPVSVLDEVLAPVDRDVFRRQLQYLASATPPKRTPPAALMSTVAAGTDTGTAAGLASPVTPPTANAPAPAAP